LRCPILEIGGLLLKAGRFGVGLVLYGGSSVPRVAPHSVGLLLLGRALASSH
jgi:hypothetical protein